MDEKRAPKKNKTTEPSGFSELKKVIEEELGHADKWDDYSNAFSPVTDGLGLESPKKKDAVLPADAKPKVEAATADSKNSAQAKRVRQKFMALSNRVEKEPKAKPAKIETEKVDPSLEVLPPPAASPSLIRRIFAGFIDQVFVLTLWLVAMVITLKVMTGSFVGGVSSSAAILEESRFLQFAIIEFATIWVAYAIFCMGVLDMTFGMWVWGIRVGYMTKSKKSWFVRKVLRTLLTFLFYAPVLPLVFLVFVGKRGRNLLDALSGTVVYQSVVVE